MVCDDPLILFVTDGGTYGVNGLAIGQGHPNIKTLGRTEAFDLNPFFRPCQ